MQITTHKKIVQHGTHRHYDTKVVSVDTEVKKDNTKTVWVKLADGNIIRRHKVKHVPAV